MSENNLMNSRNFFITQTWWGKIIGGVLGYLMHGPVGALFGILIGNLFDRGLAMHLNQPASGYFQEKRQQVQQVFFQATFTIMGHIAKSDGRVTENEIKIAKQMMDEMRLTGEQKKQAQAFFSTGKQSSFDLKLMLNMLQQICKDNNELLKLFMDIQYRAAGVDGLSKQKIQLLDYIFKVLGFTPLHQQYRFYQDFGQQNYQSTNHDYRQGQNQSRNRPNYNAYASSLAQAYAILEISETASKQDVKRAYRRLISRNHPDKLIAQGLPEKMIKMANDKTQKITKAYDQICTSKGW